MIGLIVDLVLWGVTSALAPEQNDVRGRRDIFIPFEDQTGGHQGTSNSSPVEPEQHEYYPDDFDDFGDF